MFAAALLCAAAFTARADVVYGMADAAVRTDREALALADGLNI